MQLFIHCEYICILIHALLFSICIYNAAVEEMVTEESEISAPRSRKWHCERSAKTSGNKHCKWVSHMVPMTLLYDLSASHLLLSDVPLPSINLMKWQRARLIKRNYFCSHLWVTVMQHCPSCSSFETGQDIGHVQETDTFEGYIFSKGCSLTLLPQMDRYPIV